MGKIIKLPESIANKIAAGEVVERPASVIKELVENSIDAGAGSIEIIIKNAGKDLIQVIDDGEGMSADDATLAFERHATSKIKDETDLEKIYTLGFRGEALPSIASVSMVEIKTKTENSSTGSHLYFVGGKKEFEKPVAMNKGTNLSIKNLFFNTPARRNFLRSDSAELQRILLILKRFFLGYPEIAFKVVVNDKIIYKLASQNTDHRIKEIFGPSVYDGLIHFMDEKEGVVVEGYVAKPDLARNSRGMEYMFLNLRPIENKSLNFAVIQAYGNLLERRQYPPFILYIRISPEKVDVNVHPTKMEVKFQKEQFMFRLISNSVKKALNREGVIPSFSFGEQKYSPGAPVRSNGTVTQTIKQGKLNLTDEPFDLNKTVEAFNLGHLDSDAIPDNQTTDNEDNAEKIVHIPLFQLHNRYILTQIESGLLIIDQHVAHERILFEQTLESFARQAPASKQQLLFPQTMELSIEDYLVYTEIKELLEQIGFSTSELSGNTIIINAIPSEVKIGYEGKVLLEILDEYKTTEKEYSSARERTAAAFACKNAIKSGDKIGTQEMKNLIDRLFQTKEPYFCPHGRPIIITLSLDELDRKFKRIK